MLVSQYQACKLLHCSNGFLTKQRKLGMPYVRENGRFKYDMELVHRWFGGEDFSQNKKDE